MTTPIRHGGAAQPTLLPQTPRIDTDAATQTETTHNVHQGPRAADAAEGLVRAVRAVRANGMSRAKAANALGTLPTGPAINADISAATPRAALQRQPTIRGGAVSAAPPDKAAREQTRALVNELITIIDGKTDSKTGKPLSDQIRFQKGSSGQVMMYKPSKEQLSTENRDKYMQSRSGVEAREMAGNKFALLLQGAGITIDANTRNALPSATQEGNAGQLRDLLQQTLRQMDKVDRNEHLAKDLSANPLSDPFKGALFLRANTEGANLMAKALNGMFTEDARGIVKKMNTTFESALQGAGPTPDRAAVDKALVATYQSLLQSLAEVRLSDQFGQVARELSQLVNEAADRQSTNVDAATQSVIAKNAQTCKANIVPAMLLRSLCRDLTLEMTKSESAIFKKAVAGMNVTGHEVKMSQMASALIARINNATYDKKSTVMTDSFAGFNAFIASADNNVDQFAAMKALAAGIQG